MSDPTSSPDLGRKGDQSRSGTIRDERSGVASGRTVARGVAWLLAARLTTMAVGVLSSAALARLLNPGEFGIVTAVMVVVLLGNAVSDGAFALPLVQIPTLTPALKRSAFWLSVSVAGAMSAVFVAGAPIIQLAFGIPHMVTPLMVTALVLPVRAANGVAVATLERDGRFRNLGVAQVLGNVLGYALPAVGLALLHFGVWALVAAVLLQATVESAANMTAAPLSYFGPVHRADVRRLMASGGSSTLTQILNWASVNVANLVISRLLGVIPLGYYSRANNSFTIVVNLVGSTLQRVLYPAFSQLQATPERLARALEEALGRAVLLYAVVSVGFVVNASAIVLLLLGPKWLVVAPLMQILFAAFVPRAAYKVTEAYSMSHGRFGGVAIRQAIYLALTLTGVLLGARHDLALAAVGLGAALWAFYAVSLVQAVRLAGLAWSRVLALHFRAAIVAGLLGLLDGGFVRLLTLSGATAALRLDPNLNRLVVHAAAGLLVMSLLAPFLVVAPDRLLGDDVSRIRGLARRKLGRGSAPG